MLLPPSLRPSRLLYDREGSSCSGSADAYCAPRSPRLTWHLADDVAPVTSTAARLAIHTVLIHRRHNFQPGLQPNPPLTPMRYWHLKRRSDKTLGDLAQMVNPIVRGWLNYYGRYYKSELNQSLRVLTSIWLVSGARQK